MLKLNYYESKQWLIFNRFSLLNMINKPIKICIIYERLFELNIMNYYLH